MLVVDRRGVGEQRFEVVADGENVFVARVIEVHELAHTHSVLCKGEVVGNVDESQDILPVDNRRINQVYKCALNPLNHWELKVSYLCL